MILEKKNKKKDDFFSLLTKKIPRGSMSSLSLLCVLFFLPFLCSSQLFSAERVTTWRPGIPGGVPARTTVCKTLQASAGDQTPIIQAALDSCPINSVILLGKGIFQLSGGLRITRSVVLRGQGADKTFLKLPIGTNDNLITIGTRFVSKGDLSVAFASGANKGSTSVTLASSPASPYGVGELVLVDQLTDTNWTDWGSRCQLATDDCRLWFTRPNRPIGQIVEVASVSAGGNTVTFTTPLHMDYKMGQQPQLSRFTQWTGGPLAPQVKFAGVEDLALSGGSQGQGNIEFSNAAYSWIKNVDSSLSDGPSVSIYASFRCELRDSKVHTTQTPRPGGGGYGLSLAFYSSDCLVENNIFQNFNKVMVGRASGGGTVIGYNYFEDGWTDQSPTWVESGMNVAHMASSNMILFEGNQAFNMDGENTWGNALFITAFRNHLTGRRRSIAPLAYSDQGYVRGVSLAKGHWYYNVVGNVIGLPTGNLLTTYEQTSPPWDGGAIWKIGPDTDNWDAPADARVLQTLQRGGNFDYATNSVKWESVPQQTLPDSLYLTGKPAFFGNLPWPWVDPIGANKTFTLPARLRFDNPGLVTAPAVTVPTAAPTAPITTTVASTSTAATVAPTSSVAQTAQTTGATVAPATTNVVSPTPSPSVDQVYVDGTLSWNVVSRPAAVSVNLKDTTGQPGRVCLQAIAKLRSTRGRLVLSSATTTFPSATSSIQFLVKVSAKMRLVVTAEGADGSTFPSAVPLSNFNVAPDVWTAVTVQAKDFGSPDKSFGRIVFRDQSGLTGLPYWLQDLVVITGAAAPTAPVVSSVQSSTNPATTSASPTSAAATTTGGAEFWVFKNGVFNWPGDYSFAATINYKDTSGALSGPVDIAVTPESAWGGWQPYSHNWNYDVTPFFGNGKNGYLTFAIKPTVDGWTGLVGFLKVGDIAMSTVTPQPIEKFGPTPVKGAWTVFNVPLSAVLDAGVTNIYKFFIQTQTGGTDVFFVDNCGFVLSPQPQPTATGRAVTSTTSSSFPEWAIAVTVVGGVALIAIIIVVIIVATRRSRRLARESAHVSLLGNQFK